MKHLRILLVEDSEDDAALILRSLERYGYTCSAFKVMTSLGLQTALTQEKWDVILCDYMMPGFDAPAALKIVRSLNVDIPVIIVSGTVGEEMAVTALKHGAQDYILKQNLTRLGPAVASELGSAFSRRYGRLMEGVNMTYSAVLEMILNGSALTPVLDLIARKVEELSPDGALCSILLANEAGTHLENGATPSLPAEHIKAVCPLLITENAGSCGRAAKLKETVIAEDLGADPNWERWRPVVDKYGLRACCSVPVFSSGRKVVGTLAVYYQHPRKPAEEEIRWLESAAKLAGVAIERGRSEIRLREQLEELRRWQNAMLNREDRVQELKSEVNNALERLGEKVRYTSQI